MKKISFLILSLFLSFNAKAQQNPTSDVVNASMPIGAELLTKEKLLTYVNKNYKKSQIPTDKRNTYRLDGILISFWDLSVNPEVKKSLKASQSEMLGYLARNDENTINYSKIIEINNIQFLICEYQKQDEVYLWFKSDYNKDNKDISGVLQFKKPDDDKAQKVLKDFLETVHFKE